MVELKNNITTVRVSFHALQKQYTVTELPVSVPLGLKRYGLSEIINHLLELDPIVPFDIFVNGKYLNSTLASAIEEHGLSTETVITLKFCEAFRAPSAKFQASVSDWVSSIAFLSSNLCIAGLYDSTVEIWDTNTNVLVHKSSFHTNCIKSVALISSGNTFYFRA
jgi:ribosome biogenesis protein YTM1